MNSKNEYVVIINQCQADPTIATRSRSVWVIGSWKKNCQIDMSTTRQLCIKSEMIWWTEKCFLPPFDSDSSCKIYPPPKENNPHEKPQQKSAPKWNSPRRKSNPWGWLLLPYLVHVRFKLLCVFLTVVECTATSRWNSDSHRITEVKELNRPFHYFALNIIINHNYNRGEWWLQRRNMF